jgi:hypothetical protein
MKSNQKKPRDKAPAAAGSPAAAHGEVPENVKALIDVLVGIALEEHRKRILGRLAGTTGGATPADGQQPR